MYNIKTLNNISQNGLKLLDTAKYSVSDSAAEPDAILVRSAKMHDYAFEPSLRAIVRAGAGVNNIPIDQCSERGIVVFNTPGANANAVKELAIGALILAGRDILGGIDWVRSLAGTEGVTAAVEKGKSAFVGPEISGKTLGVIGLGAIGIMVANAATSLGMKVLGYDPYISVDAAWNLSRSVNHALDLDTIYANSDFITIHVPATNETKGMLNTEAFAKMRDGVRIINIARGELVNDADMIAALESGKVARYVTDFPNENVLGHAGVVPFPHLGASTPESEENCAVMACEQLIEFLENGNIRNSVNFPAVFARRVGVRVCLAHRNKPGVLSAVTNCMSVRSINIENITSKSRGDYAYTMVDLTQYTDDVIEALRGIPDILSCRVIK